MQTSSFDKVYHFFLHEVVIAIPLTIPRSAILPEDLLILIFSQLFFLVIGGRITMTGFSIFVYTNYLFYQGQGTLAPIHPPTPFVVEGPYSYVRNPMIIGVLMMLFGEVLVYNLKYLLYFCAFFLLVNSIYFMSVEEPKLKHRFGNFIRVSRWIPNMHPYEVSKEE